MGAEANSYVLDSYAILAYVGGEKGEARVREVLDQARAGRCRTFLSVINLGEVAYIVERERGAAKAGETLGLVDQLPIDVLPATKEAVLSAAHIKAKFPIAYADAFAVAAAQILGATVLTGDPEFDSVKQLIAVEQI